MQFKIIPFLLIFVSHTLQAQNTIIPDSNFEQRLIDLGYDSGSIDGVVPTMNINTVTDLIVPNSNISDFTGIEDFIALENLDCIGNPISSLDLSNNMSLISLYTGNNLIETLDVTNNLNLETLVCTGHQLTELDISNNNALKMFWCNTGTLINLDLSNNMVLENFNCENNLLTSLNLKNGANGDLTTMRAENNNLVCVEVDDATAATGGTGSYSSWQIDLGTTYSESCVGCPEMEVSGNMISIISGDTTPESYDNTDFGTVNFGEFLDHTFTIENIGSEDLDLTGSPIIQVLNSVDFTISTPPSSFIAANGGISTFTVRYSPSMAGTINTATLIVENNDCDENPYTFDVMGQSATLGIEEEDFSSYISVIPNPSKGKFTIKSNQDVLIQKVKIYDINGRLIQWMSLFYSNNMYEFNVQHGMYIIEIIVDNKTIIKKLLVN